MCECKVAQIPSNWALECNFQHSKYKPYTVPVYDAWVSGRDLVGDGMQEDVSVLVIGRRPPDQHDGLLPRLVSLLILSVTGKHKQNNHKYNPTNGKRVNKYKIITNNPTNGKLVSKNKIITNNPTNATDMSISQTYKNDIRFKRLVHFNE